MEGVSIHGSIAACASARWGAGVVGGERSDSGIVIIDYSVTYAATVCGVGVVGVVLGSWYLVLDADEDARVGVEMSGVQGGV